MDIGKQRRVIEVTPLEVPEEVPAEPMKAPEPTRTEPEPEKVPAK